MQTKQCSKCLEEKPLDKFYKCKKHRDGLAYYCKKCSDERRAAWGKANPDRHHAIQKRYYDTHTEQIKQYYLATREQRREKERVHREKHRDRFRDYLRRYYQEHKERLNQLGREYYRQHRDEMIAANTRRQRGHPKRKEWVRRYAQKHPDKLLAQSHLRRARKQANGGTYTPEQWEALKNTYDHRCLCCGKREPDIKLTLDHVVPLSRGGSNDISNIQPLCRFCNTSKGSRTIDYRPALRPAPAYAQLRLGL